jgi:hypothetical protein
MPKRKNGCFSRCAWRLLAVSILIVLLGVLSFVAIQGWSIASAPAATQNENVEKVDQ